jgi:hypothetical protein
VNERNLLGPARQDFPQLAAEYLPENDPEVSM